MSNLSTSSVLRRRSRSTSTIDVLPTNEPLASPGSISFGDEHGTWNSTTRKRRKVDVFVDSDNGSDRDTSEEEEVDELISDDGDQGVTSPGLARSNISELGLAGEQLREEIGFSNPVAEASASNPVEQRRNTTISPSLAKILHPTNIEPLKSTETPSSPSPGAPVASSSSSKRTLSLQPPSLPPSPFPPAKQPSSQSSYPEPEPLSCYTCPICFCSPTNATLTPCGHVCCGSCLFTAVKTTMQRTALIAEEAVPRCPVCRAPIPGWDGKGGGVIGLKMIDCLESACDSKTNSARFVYSLQTANAWNSSDNASSDNPGGKA